MEPSSSMSSSGKSRFSICIWKVLPSWFYCWVGTVSWVFWDGRCFRSPLYCCMIDLVPPNRLGPRVLRSSRSCCRTATARSGSESPAILPRHRSTLDHLNQVVSQEQALQVRRFQALFHYLSDSATHEVKLLNIRFKCTSAYSSTRNGSSPKMLSSTLTFYYSGIGWTTTPPFSAFWGQQCWWGYY